MKNPKLTIKLFNHQKGGWYHAKVECWSDVEQLLEEDGTRLPYPSEIDKSHRYHMYTDDELYGIFTGIKVR